MLTLFVFITGVHNCLVWVFSVLQFWARCGRDQDLQRRISDQQNKNLTQNIRMPAQTATEATTLQYPRLAWISQLTNLKRHQS